MYIGQIYCLKEHKWITTNEFKTKKEAEKFVKDLTTGIYPVKKEDVRFIKN